MKLDNLPAEIVDLVRRQRQEKEEAREEVLNATAAGDEAGFRRALLKAGDRAMLGLAIKAMSQYSGTVSVEIKQTFLRIWIEDGDLLRTESLGDLVILEALKRFLPSYEGQPLTLYRGDSFFNRCRRTYGMSWSASQEVAENFAGGMWRAFSGGSVVLRAEVPLRAIIAKVPVVDDKYGEEEYLVDRRYLGAVFVVRRLSQISFEEHPKACEGDNDLKDCQPLQQEPKAAGGRGYRPSPLVTPSQRRSNVT
jgi:hypothetical protein